ncbi:uncharacterized protein EV422DRAFT_239786 [Fimicolochytrium jonesii]|uniref:uncharacterized protein n=1 Tax=Fimicolochytrium jonesii TaxID=1396493 RepID=UPI0022FECEE7|nr:uncharacterized protein EV422DRAFT_239786 [Fimicolochytrium jonesii]KAI8824974.1 hypothetical protein EV422DRAFT_239786 [Fimicolochytrium jonesii]
MDSNAVKNSSAGATPAMQVSVQITHMNGQKKDGGASNTDTAARLEQGQPGQGNLLPFAVEEVVHGFNGPFPAGRKSPLSAGRLGLGGAWTRRKRNFVMVALTVAFATFAAAHIALIRTHAEYGPRSACMLFISAYQETPTSYSFVARSTACHTNIILSSLSLATALALLPLILLLTPKKPHLFPALLTLIPAALLTVSGALTLKGLRETCDNFTTVRGGRCADVYDAGLFWNSDWTKVYFVRLAAVQAAAGVAYAGALTAVISSVLWGMQWWRWRKVRWW